MIGDDGRPAAALISVEDLADLEDGAALAMYLADKAAGRDNGLRFENAAELDAGLDRIDGQEP